MENNSTDINQVLTAQLHRLLSSRDYPKTICPSEATRALSAAELQNLGVPSWRDLMPTVRQILWDMRQLGEVEILQKGVLVPETVKLEDIKGPIRARSCHLKVLEEK